MSEEVVLFVIYKDGKVRIDSNTRGVRENKKKNLDKVAKILTELPDDQSDFFKERFNFWSSKGGEKNG